LEAGWYFGPGKRFGGGLMVNWFDFTGAFKSKLNRVSGME
jgi:hypothetical protein